MLKLNGFRWREEYGRVADVLQQKQYERRLVLRVAQSSRRTTLLCRGEGIEPRLEFSRSVVEFSAVVPYFAVEEELTICNPCSFPVELYSVEFDKMHLEDEKVNVAVGR